MRLMGNAYIEKNTEDKFWIYLFVHNALDYRPMNTVIFCTMQDKNVVTKENWKNFKREFFYVMWVFKEQKLVGH